MLMFACSSDDGDSGARTVTFTEDIHPVLLAKCGASGCHDGNQAPILPGHADVDVQAAYDATQAEYQDTDQRVYERILARVTSEDPTAIMPPPYTNPPCQGMIGAPGCITEAELALIQEWIAQGTPL
jgi:hypothetical protein